MSEEDFYDARKVVHAAIVMMNKGYTLFHKAMKAKKADADVLSSYCPATTYARSKHHHDLVASTRYFQKALQAVNAAIKLARGAECSNSGSFVPSLQHSIGTEDVNRIRSTKCTQSPSSRAIPVGENLSRVPCQRQQPHSVLAQLQAEQAVVDPNRRTRNSFLIHCQEGSNSPSFLTSSLAFGSLSLHLCVVPMRSFQTSLLPKQMRRQDLERLSQIVLVHATFSLAVTMQLQMISGPSAATPEQRAKCMHSATDLYDFLLRLRFKDFPSWSEQRQSSSYLLRHSSPSPFMTPFVQQTQRYISNATQEPPPFGQSRASCQHQLTSSSILLDLSILNNAALFYFEIGYNEKCKECVEGLQLRTSNVRPEICMLPTSITTTTTIHTTTATATTTAGGSDAFRLRSQELGHLFTQHLGILHYLLHLAPAAAA